MAQTFRQRIAQAEAMARADMLRFQPEVFMDYLFLKNSESGKKVETENDWSGTNIEKHSKAKSEDYWVSEMTRIK